MSGRKLNALEQKLHQGALAAEDKTLTPKELESMSPDAAARTAALNFLLSAGLLKMLKDAKGKILFRAVGKREVEVKKDLTGEEAIVLGHIQAAGNEGIWTKHIKVKTELHQTVLDRCLKSLTQKQLVKAVKGSVQHPTRKMYMLFHLEPSVEVTGGPWYTDKELDTEFIKMLLKACLKFIRDRSQPRAKSSSDSSSQRQLFPISASPPYPSPAQIQAFLNKSRITETQLSVEHVEMLLEVLVLDGEIEKVPAMGAALWESSADTGDRNASESEEEYRKNKKRKRSEDSERRRKRKRRMESGSGSDSESDVSSKRKQKKRKSRDDSDEESDSEEVTKRRKKKGKKRRAERSDEGDSDTESENDRKKKRSKSSSSSSSKSKSKRRKYESSPPSSSSESESDAPSRRSKSKSKRSSSPAMALMDESFTGGVYVYRAIQSERLLSFGFSQAPCGRCPQFDFCKGGGPVNPQECVYFEEWLGKQEVKIE
ncbi:unnamed protein product [Somion occarium]|uniref:DNA-directed RNA polymerase III subunit RPC6 n=1 Tax=Somion occarium TaxID=3059160 RepID=A0ABP1CV69_9APHY